MGNRRRNLFILLFVAGLIAASVAVIASNKTVLGLDLRGGTELIYQGRPTPQQPQVTGSAIDRSIEIIRQRTDKLGVSEPEISRIGQDSIRVGLPDVQNADRAIAQVGTTAQLYLYDWTPNVIPKPGAQSPTEQGFPRLYDAVKFASTQAPSCQGCTTGTQYYLFGKQSLQQIGTGPQSSRKDLFANLAGGKQPPNSVVVAVPQGTIVVQDAQQSTTAPPEYFVLKDRPALSGTDITDPKPSTDNNGAPDVTFGFTDSGRTKFHDVTRAIAQRGLANALPGSNPQTSSQTFAIVLDQQVKSRPIIDYSQYPDGIDGRTGAQISGHFTPQQANDLATILQIGALPIKLELISQSTVSATLGQQALDQGLKAGIVGLGLILIFLLLYYRFLGFVAGIGLLIYAIFFFALIKLIPITLTLPGIAGLVLTIGVAADANIVIFERIREEARAGKSIPSAIAVGYRKGIATIIDANVITLITAFILFVLATAGVKGFAFVLGVGTIVSLFTAVVFTQAFLGLFGRAKFMRSGSFIGAKEQRVHWHFDFMGASKWFFSMSGTILIVGAVALATLQLNLGIDFKSGTRIQVALNHPASVDQVRSTLSGAGVADAEVQSVQNPKLGANVFQIQTKTLPPDQVGKVQTALDGHYGVVQNGFDNQSIGPTFGKQVAKSAIYAVIFSLLVICAYVAFRFEPKYAVPVLIALFHDVLITGGVYSLSGREVTSGTIAAFLTILGYSLYDTVIVFDRIRENVPRLPRAAFSQIVNRSMSEVLTRSLITGLSTVFLVTVLLIFGGATLQDFAFAMMVGIASGTYSSIFIASPVLTAWKEREPAYRKRRERIVEQMGYLPPFPEENVIAKLEDGPTDGAAEGEPVPAAADGGGAPAPPSPAPQTPAALQGQSPEAPAPLPDTLGQPVPTPPPPAPSRADTPVPGGDGGGNGEGAREQPELSDASAAALERMRAERSGKRGGGGRRRRKHGRNR